MYSLTPVKEAILLKLRLAAEKSGMTPLSEKTGIDRGNLYKVLNENANPKLDTLIKIASALGYEVRVSKGEPKSP